MESWSFTLPPGWMMALIPSFAQKYTTSRNGKNASEARTRSPENFSLALCTACSVAQILLTCPPPIPNAWIPLETTMALDFTYFTTPVSYTHLDVYKRQVSTSSKWLIQTVEKRLIPESNSLLFSIWNLAFPYSPFSPFFTFPPKRCVVNCIP